MDCVAVLYSVLLPIRTILLSRSFARSFMYTSDSVISSISSSMNSTMSSARSRYLSMSSIFPWQRLAAIPSDWILDTMLLARKLSDLHTTKTSPICVLLSMFPPVIRQAPSLIVILIPSQSSFMSMSSICSIMLRSSDDRSYFLRSSSNSSIIP